MDEYADGDDLQGILSEQRRELLLAKTLDSDLDMAFNLQMKEALTASLADLDRRIYDQKFAASLRDLPEDYWKEYGDKYEKPYCTDGSSSSKAHAVETEGLRMYCKGLISEEVVKNVKVAVGGIGVAICDPRENLVFEAKKNIKVLIDGDVMSNEAAELEALCDGLNKALMLDLKNVTFFMDDNKLYQYVTNKLIPGNSKIATLVNQVALLQRKFVSCRPSLVASGEIKFAFKFARDAIVSQISWCVKTQNGKSFKETCAICFEETDVARMFSIDDCLHRYCISCMKKHVEVKLLSGMVAQCPHEACNSEVYIDSYEQFLAPNIVAVMSQRIKESSIPVGERVYCPKPKCSALMSKKEVFEYTITSYAGASESAARKCMKCHLYFCLECMVPWHYKMSCEEYKQSHPFPLKEDQLLKSLATTKQWRNCKKCNHMVELAEGCNHITCRCGYQFCYTCGAEWKSKKPTCSCPLWDERYIIHEQPRPVQPVIPEQAHPVQPIIHEQPRQVQRNVTVRPRVVAPGKRQSLIHEQPRQVQRNVTVRPRVVAPGKRQSLIHEQPRPVQPVIPEQAHPVQPIIHEQPRQVQRNVTVRPRVVAPGKRQSLIHEQPRPVQPVILEQAHPVQPIIHEQPRQVQCNVTVRPRVVAPGKRQSFRDVQGRQVRPRGDDQD